MEQMALTTLAQCPEAYFASGMGCTAKSGGCESCVNGGELLNGDWARPQSSPVVVSLRKFKRVLVKRCQGPGLVGQGRRAPWNPLTPSSPSPQA